MYFKKNKSKLISILLIIFSSVLISCSSSDEQTTPNASFTNTRWVLRTLDDKKINTPAGGKEAYITFTTDAGKFQGNGSCNNFFGTYKKNGKSLTVGPAASTEMYCEGRMETETSFLKSLSTAVRYSIKGNYLYFYNSSSKSFAKFEAVYLK